MYSQPESAANVFADDTKLYNTNSKHNAEKKMWVKNQGKYSSIYIYEVQLSEEADCNEVIWCKLVTWHTTVTIGVV